MKYSDKDMLALISEVETKFAEHLAKAQAETTDLKKSEDTTTVETKTEEVTAQPNETVTAQTVEKSEPENEEIQYSEDDVQEMDQIYASMTKSEAATHLKSLKKALGEDKEVTAEVQEVKKSEDETVKVEETTLLKSEIEAKDKEITELKKSFEGLTAALAKYVKGSKAPEQKAITKLEFIAKSEEDKKQEPTETKKDISKLSKKEISALLADKIRTGKLEKSDRDNVDHFYYTGQSNIELIKHLL